MKALFLDRDGVLNVLRHNDYVKTPDELEIAKYLPAMFGPPTPVLSTPITPKENQLRLY